MTIHNIKPDYEAVTGSHLYGMATETSDVDIRGFVLESEASREYLPFPNQKFEQLEYKDEDKVIYGLAKFLQLLAKGNVQCLEALYSNQIITCSDIGKMVLDNKEMFLSKAYHRSIKGFVMAEWRKAKCVNLLIEPDRPDRSELAHQLCSVYHLKRYQRDQLLELIEEFTGEKLLFEVPNDKIGERRKLDYSKIGYSPKNASHTIRLLYEGIQLFKEQTLTFPLCNHESLLSIKKGTIPFDEVEALFNNLLATFEEVAENSDLPRNCSIHEVNDLYKCIINYHV